MMTQVRRLMKLTGDGSLAGWAVTWHESAKRTLEIMRALQMCGFDAVDVSS